MRKVFNRADDQSHHGDKMVSEERERSKTKLVNMFSIVAMAATSLFIVNGVFFGTGNIGFEFFVLGMMCLPLLLNSMRYYSFARLALVLAINIILTITLFLPEYGYSIKFGVIIPVALGGWFFYGQNLTKLLISYGSSFGFLFLSFLIGFSDLQGIADQDKAAMFYELAYYGAIVTGMVLFQMYSIETMLATEKKLKVRLRYEQGISGFTTALLHENEEDFQNGLTFLLLASGASRVYIFENKTNTNAEVVTSQIYEACRPGVKPQLDNPLLKDFSYAEAGFGRWLECFEKNEYIMGNVSDFPPEEQGVLAVQGIKSILVLPYRIGGKWAGVIGFDQVDKPRNWNKLDINLLSTVTNITGIYFENLRQKEQLQENNKQLHGLNNTKDKLFSIIAHDLINPFHSLIGLSDLLKSSLEEKDYETCNDLAYHLSQTSINTFRLLENLLTWSRAQSGKIVFTPALVDMNALLNHVYELLKPMAANKKVGLIMKIEAPVIMKADASMIELVFRNLISNAIKFTPEGGIVEISNRKPSLQAHQFTIRDTGIGIEAGQLETLLNDNKNESTQGTSGEKGTGLGLMLCKDFVQQHSGTLSAESEPGKGTSFLLTFPATDRA